MPWMRSFSAMFIELNCFAASLWGAAFFHVLQKQINNKGQKCVVFSFLVVTAHEKQH